MRSSRLVAALLALLFAAIGAAPVLLDAMDPASWAWAAVVWSMALGFLLLVFLIPARHHRATY